MAEGLWQRLSDQGELAVEARDGKREGTIAKNVPPIAYRCVARNWRTNDVPSWKIPQRLRESAPPAGSRVLRLLPR
jgi:hypothetical protein